MLRRVELCSTAAADERQKVKHVILVPHRGARIRVKSVKAVGGVPAAAPSGARASSGMHS